MAELMPGEICLLCEPVVALVTLVRFVSRMCVFVPSESMLVSKFVIALITLVGLGSCMRRLMSLQGFLLCERLMYMLNIFILVCSNC